MKRRFRFTALMSSLIMLCGMPLGVRADEAAPTQTVRYRNADGTGAVALTPLDDRGLWGAQAQNEWSTGSYQFYMEHIDDSQTVVGHDSVTGEPQYGTVYDQIIITVPRKNYLTFALRGLSPHYAPGYREERDEKLAAVREIIAQFYPPDADGNLPVRVYASEWDDAVELYAPGETAGSQEIAEGLMHALFDAGLIKSFYSWGETLDYSVPNFYDSLLQFPAEPTTGWSPDPLCADPHGEPIAIDWNDVRAWLSENYPGTELVEVYSDGSEQTAVTGYSVSAPNYNIGQKFELLAAFEANFGIRFNLSYNDLYYRPLFGEDMLASSIPDSWERVQINDGVYIYNRTSDRWFDAEGKPLTDGTEQYQQALYEGEHFSVHVSEQPSVWSIDNPHTKNETLTALLPEYLTFRPIWVSGVNGVYEDEAAIAEANDMIRSLPLTYRFRADVEPFVCEVYLGDTLLGGMQYSIDAGDTPEAVPWMNEEALTLEKAVLQPGDANLNGSADIADAVLSARYIAEDREIHISQLGVMLSDTDGDGDLTSADLAEFLSTLARNTK